MGQESAGHFAQVLRSPQLPPPQEVWEETQAPPPHPAGPGGPAPQPPSRAAEPPNQRPLRAGSRFKLGSCEFAEKRAVAAAAAAPCGPWSTASWAPGRTGPPSW